MEFRLEISTDDGFISISRRCFGHKIEYIVDVLYFTALSLNIIAEWYYEGARSKDNIVTQIS